ncbi:MAG: phosphatase PAP2 family protein [Bacteroidaceae bacterium]|nr:phosphatase PAP2 family protein [Bacteroidaceae bacterium]
MNEIQNIDNELIIAFNSNGNPVWDVFWWIYTSAYAWIPLAFVLLFYICYFQIRNSVRSNQKEAWKQVAFATLAFAFMFLLCDQIPASVIKPLVARLRPSHNPDLMGRLTLINGYTGGLFGFPSNHACNDFGCAMLLTLFFRRWKTSCVAFLWAAGSCYSRMYLGVHYPTDILVGALLGVLFAFIVYRLYRKIGGNPTEYRHDEPWWITVVFLLTIITILIISIFYENFI